MAKRQTRARNVGGDANTMTLDRFLVVSKTGNTRILTTVPALAPTEIAISLRIDIPKAIFQKPSISAHVKIPRDAVAQTEITSEVTQDIKKAIEGATGLMVHIDVQHHGDGK